MAWTAAAVIGSSLIGGAIQSNSAGRAASTQAQAAQQAAAAQERAAGQALKFQREARDEARALYDPLLQAGAAADARLAALLYGRGATGDFYQPETAQTRAMRAWQGDPNAIDWAETVRRNPRLDPATYRPQDWGPNDKGTQRALAAGFDPTTPAGRAEAALALWPQNRSFMTDDVLWTGGELAAEAAATAQPVGQPQPEQSGQTFTRDQVLDEMRQGWDWRQIDKRRGQAGRARDRALDAWKSAAASDGNFFSGLGLRGMGEIEQDYEDTLIDFENEAYDNLVRGLESWSNRGDQARSGVASGGQTFANNAGELTMSGGRARAEGIINAGNARARRSQAAADAWASGVNNVAWAAGNYWGGRSAGGNAAGYGSRGVDWGGIENWARGG